MSLFPAFRSRNYRLFFAGQLISLVGTWMQQIAMTWLAYRLTGSPLMLGLVVFSSQIPILLFGIPAGVWNDRFDRRRLLMLTQTLAMVQACLLFALSLTDAATPAMLILLAAVLGCINAVDMPARQAFVAQLVEEKADLANAIGLNSLLMNASRFIGPAIAGLIVASLGEAACFLLNAISYLGVLLALAAMRLAPQAVVPAQGTLSALRAGLDYAFRHPKIRLSLLMVAGFSFVVAPYAAMMPVFARDLLAGGADTYGFLIGSAGCGSLGAALLLALRGARHQARGLDRMIAGAILTGGIALTGFATLPASLLAYPLLAMLGFSVVLAAAGTNILIQMIVAEQYRGRVMAIFSVAFLGVAPLGSLAVGAIGTVLGVRPTLIACGVLAACLGLHYRSRLKIAG